MPSPSGGKGAAFLRTGGEQPAQERGEGRQDPNRGARKGRWNRALSLQIRDYLHPHHIRKQIKWV